MGKSSRGEAEQSGTSSVGIKGSKMVAAEITDSSLNFSLLQLGPPFLLSSEKSRNLLLCL
jgi:hypothetical protein